MRIGYSDDFGGVNGRQIGQVNETASIAYTGELLPAGTASYGGIAIDATKRYLKNSGKDKTPALVESGQGKFFNGTSQFINTGATPNDTVGTFVTRFTYESGAIQKIMAGMNYSNNRCYMGINASGKIGVGFGANTYDTLFSPDVLVAGQSYHVAFRYSGTEYWLFVDSVLKATGTITGLSSFVGTTFYIGALNNGGTPSNYFNSVIDETYYYDVALTDAQIETLYLYPEKIKAYNGAIVPDIGSEANCKLFLPMCENSGSNVVNVAVASGSNIVVNGGFDTDTEWAKGTGWTISGGVAVANITSSSTLHPSINLGTIGKSYIVTFDITITSGSLNQVYCGGRPIGNAIINNKFTSIAINTTNTQHIAINAVNFVGSIDNVSVKEITAYPLASYATTMHTSAAKLSYGAQCTAWKRDSLGVLLGMSNGLSFDGGVSVKDISTGFTPLLATNFVIEVILPTINDGVDRWFGYQNAGNSMGAIRKHTSNVIYAYTFNGNGNPSGVLNTQYSHYIIKYDGTTKLHSFYIDGVFISNRSTVATVENIYALVLGNSTWKSLSSAYKIHKGAQYAKFNIAKAWAKAQKTIAKLGA